MIHRQSPGFSRRHFIQSAASITLATGIGAPLVPRPARAQPKTLKILTWKHFVPGYSEWYIETYVKEWGEKNNTRVIVDTVGIGDLNEQADREVAAQKGHDLFLFLWPRPIYEDQVIDHRDIYEECERQYGKPLDLAIRTTYNPKTKKFYGFCDYYFGLMINYRKDLWDAVGMLPDTWENIRRGGRILKLLHERPVGIGLGPEVDGNAALRAILYSFGASVQTAAGQPALKSKATLEALKFVKALYEETMQEEVVRWDPASNNRFMLSGLGSLVLNAISITRTAENKHLPIGEHIWLAPAAQGPVRRLSPANSTSTHIIWKFAENIAGAKQFLVDYIGQFREGFIASEFYHLPCFPQTVPDLATLVAQDPKATPSTKYQLLTDVPNWTTNVGYPGYANAAIDEILNTRVISTMFAQAATGQLKPGEALDQANGRVQHIFAKWQARGKV